MSTLTAPSAERVNFQQAWRDFVKERCNVHEPVIVSRGLSVLRDDVTSLRLMLRSYSAVSAIAARLLQVLNVSLRLALQVSAPNKKPSVWSRVIGRLTRLLLQRVSPEPSLSAPSSLNQ